MKLFFIISTLIFSFDYGQDNNQQSKFNIGAFVSNDIGYRSLKHDNSKPYLDLILEDRNEREIPKYCYSAGLSVEYAFSKKVSLRSGILYSNKGYQTTKINLSSGSLSSSFPNAFKNKYNLSYIDIPMIFNYRFGNNNNKSQFYLGAGLTTNIFLQETRTSIQYYDDEVIRKKNKTKDEYNRINISPRIEFGIIYDINERLYLTAGPSFNYGVIKIIDTPITAYLYSGGFHLNLNFK